MDAREQLAMDKSDDHQNWDARAICSMIKGLTEESKLETFVNSIPGTFNSWGQEVCYVLVERSARLELGGYDSVVWHVALEACASGTL